MKKKQWLKFKDRYHTSNRGRYHFHTTNLTCSYRMWYFWIYFWRCKFSKTPKIIFKLESGRGKMGIKVHKFFVDKKLQHRKSKIMFASGYSYISSEIRWHSVMRSIKLSMEMAFPLNWNLTFQQILLKMI